MPRRFATSSVPPAAVDRLKFALLEELDRPRVDEVIQSQDSKLREIKKLVFSNSGGPVKLSADPAVPLSSVVELPAPPQVISTHYNDHEQSVIAGGEPRDFNDIDVDFSKAEDFFQLEAPIDARKDQNMLQLASTIPRHTFMRRLLRRYPINRKRLAFIQRRPNAKPLELVGAMMGGAKGESKEMAVSCQVCGQRFSKQHHFQRHILTHMDPENKKFLCQVCGKRFNRADHLNRHAILHGDTKVHKCLLCGEEFDRASHLDRHRRKLHPPAGQAPSQTPPLTPQLQSPAELSLSPSTPLDSQSSGNNLHLLAAVATPDSNHLNSDPISESDLQIVQSQLIAMETEAVTTTEPEPERPFSCESCGRKFIRATHLRRHMRIHTGEKPFACHICGRRYARGDYLRAHIHAHRRDKIHKCKHCGEVFHDLTRFADHCRAQHKDDDDEFGNPMQPPENSPPPPPINRVLEGTLVAEAAEEITVVAAGPMETIRYEPIPQITLVNIPDPSQTGEILIPSTHHHHLPTPSRTPLTSPELQLAALIQNGQLQSLPFSEASEVTILDQARAQYLDPVTHYMMQESPFPTPTASPVVMTTRPPTS